MATVPGDRGARAPAELPWHVGVDPPGMVALIRVVSQRLVRGPIPPVVDAVATRCLAQSAHSKHPVGEQCLRPGIRATVRQPDYLRTQADDGQDSHDRSIRVAFYTHHPEAEPTLETAETYRRAARLLGGVRASGDGTGGAAHHGADRRTSLAGRCGSRRSTVGRAWARRMAGSHARLKLT